MTTNLGDLASGASATVTVETVVSADLTNTAAANGEGPNGDSYGDTDDAVVDLIAPAIKVDKTVSLDGSVPGLQSVQGTNGQAITW